MGRDSLRSRAMCHPTDGGGTPRQRGEKTLLPVQEGANGFNELVKKRAEAVQRMDKNPTLLRKLWHWQRLQPVN